MNRQAFRSLSSRARPELEQKTPIMSTYFRTAFSTTSPLLESDESSSRNSQPKGTLRDQTRAVGARVAEMLKQRPARTAQAAAKAPGSGGKVLDVRVLPRGGLRGRGGFRGRGGSPGARGGAAGNTSNRFAGARGGAAGGTSNRFAGASPGRGGGRGRGGARGGRAGRDGNKDGEKAEEETDSYEKEKAEDKDQGLDSSLKHFDHIMRFGETTVWTPEASAKSLASYMPAVPSAAAAAARAAVLKNIAMLADGSNPTFAGGADRQLSSEVAYELRERGMRFFPDPSTKADAEAALQEWRAHIRQLDETLKEKGEEPAYSKEYLAHLRALVDAEGPMLQGAEESIKKTVVDRAVRGVHEKPVFAQDTPGLVRSWGLREGTYTDDERKKFESKVLGLLAKAQKGAPQQKAKAK